MKSSLTLLFVVLMNLVARAQLSGAYTINPNKKDSGTNYASVSEAAQDLVKGYRAVKGIAKNGPGVSGPVVFKITDGSWSTYAYFTKIKGASSKNTITFQSESGDSSKVTLMYTNSYGTIFTFDTAQYINFKNITLNTPYNSNLNSLMLFEDGAGNINFSGCRFIGYNSLNPSVISIAVDADNVVFNNNYFQSYSTAISFSTTFLLSPTTYNALITNNIFDSGNTAIYINNANNASVLANTIESNSIGSEGIIINNSKGSINVNNNKVNAAYGIAVAGTYKSTSGTIANNMIISTASAIQITNAKNLNVYYNSCTINKSSGYYSQFTYAIDLQSDTISMKDNIFANFADGFAIGLFGSAKVITSDYNVLYVPDSAVGYFGSTSTTAKKEYGISDWRASTGLDLYSVNFNPLFRSVFDNHALSPLLKLGTPISGITTDIDNKIRSVKTPTIGANELTVYQTDAGVNTIDSLQPVFCRGSIIYAYARLANYGTDSLKSTTINWTINGVLQPAVAWTGKMAPGKTTEVKLGLANFTRAGAIKVWTAKYNSLADSNHINDSASMPISVRMNGSYTLGGYGADFKSFNDAKNELTQEGVCGPVVISVKDSIYTEQVSMPPIKGTSATNTITFKSKSGDSTKVVLSYPSSKYDSVPNYVLKLDYGRHYIFQNLGFQRTGSDSNATVLYLNSSDSNTFKGNMFISNKIHVLKTVSAYKNIVINIWASAYNLLNGNLVRYGSTGIQNTSSNSYLSATPGHNKLTGNIIDSVYFYGIFNDIDDSLYIGSNTVSNILYGQGTGIYDAGPKFTINGNKIFLPFGGTCIHSAPYTGCMISNNFIRLVANQYTLPNYGIQAFDPNGSEFIENNNINITGWDTTSAAISLETYTQPPSKAFFTYNNNLVNNASGYDLWMSSDAYYKYSKSDNNNFFVNGKNIFGVFAGNIYSYIPTNYNNIINWTKITGLDSNSLTIPAWYKSDIDIHAQNPRLAKKGKSLTNITTDIDGKTRNTKPTIGANELNPLADDAGVKALISPPLNFCAGVNDYKVTLRNYGTDTITSDSISWSLLNVKQKTYGFLGKIAPGDSAIVDIGNGTLLYSTSTDWFTSKNPNGNTDLNKVNDTASYIFNASMFGTYTIGGTSPDFTTIGEAVSTLVKSHVCNPVIFKIRNGTYKEQVTIPYVPDVSALKSVTFESETGDSSKVIITYPSSSKSTDLNYIVQLDSASNLHFKNLTLRRTGTGLFSRLIYLSHFAGHDVFENCNFMGVRSPVSVAIKSALITKTSGYGNAYKYCNFKYGSYALALSDTSFAPGVDFTRFDTIAHCKIDSSISGLTTTVYCSNDSITNFVYDAIIFGRCVASYIYSPINITEALNECYAINCVIATSAPVGLANSGADFSNIELLGGGNCSSSGVVAIENQYALPIARNNNIMFHTPQGGTLYKFAGTLDSNYINYNNVYDLVSLDADMVSLYYPQSLVLQFNDRGGVNQWGTYYDNDLRTYGYPDKNSISVDPMIESVTNPIAINPKLAHKGRPIAGITTDFFGHPRDTISPSIGAVEIHVNTHNIAPLAIVNQQICGDTGYSISAVFQNRGTSSEKKIPVFAQVNVNGIIQTISDTIAGPVSSLSTDTFTFRKHVNMYTTGTYKTKTWVALSTDQDRNDDTITSTTFIVGNRIPKPKDTTLCSQGPARLTLDSLNSGDQVAWFKNANDTKPISTNDTFVTGTITGDSTFYVSEQAPQNLHFGLMDTIGYNNLRANTKATFIFSTMKTFTIDSVTVYPQHNGYFRIVAFDGSKYSYYPYKVTVNYAYQPIRVPIKITFQAVTGYNYLGIDSISTGNLIYSTPKNSNNCPFSSGISGIFSFQYSNLPYFYNWSISTVCLLRNFPYKIKITGKPTFSLDENPGFQGKYNAGTLANPDHACVGNSLIYNLFTSFSDASYGSSWKIKSLSFQSIGGASSKDTQLIKPSSKGIGKFIFNPKTYSGSDSIFKLTITSGATSSSGCDSTLTRYIRVAGIDKAKFSVFASSVCTNHTVYFKDSSANDPLEKHFWNFGDGTDSTSKSPSHTYAAGGIYQAILTITDPDGCPDTFSRTIHVYDYPNVKINSATSVCSGSSIQLSDATVSGPGFKRKWYLGDGTTDTANTLNHYYTNSGNYTVKLVESNNNQCPDSASEVINVMLTPKAKLVYDSTSCLGTATHFSNGSTNETGNSGILYYGDGNYDYLANIGTHTYSSTGKYKAELIVYNSNGCSDTAYGNITIYTIPTAQFNYSKSICVSGSEKPTDITNPTAVSRTWDFGDGTKITNASATPFHTYSSAGTYTITLSAFNSKGCQGSISEQVTVNSLPKAILSADTATCLGGKISVKDLSTNPNGSRTWDFGDGNTNSYVNSTNYYQNPGNYTIKLTEISSAGCLGSPASTSVTIYSNPVAYFDINDSIQCISDSFKVTDSSTTTSGYLTKWSWNFGDGTVSSSQNPTAHLYKSTSPSQISLLVTSNYGCQDSLARGIIIYPTPTAAFNLSDTAHCLSGNNFSFTDKSTIGSTNRISGWLWNFGDGSSSNLHFPGLHNYAKDSLYQVYLKVTSINGCSDSTTRKLSVYPQPHVSFTVNDSVQCLKGNNFIFKDNSNISSGIILSRKWKFGNTDSSALQNPDYSFATPGIYPVGLSVTSNNGCKSMQYDSVIVNPNPVFSAGTSTSVCSGISDTLGSIKVNGINYNWSSNPVGFTSSLSNPVVAPATSTRYYLTETIIASGCAATDSVFIKVRPMPIVLWKEYNVGSTYVFQALDSSLSSSDYFWTFGDGSTSYNGYDASHIYPKNKNYQVKLLVNDTDGCSNELDSTINVTASGIDQAINNFLKIKIYPNPFDQSTTVECLASISTNIKIDLYDFTGKLISGISDGDIQSGIVKWRINADDYHLSKGVYFLKVITSAGELNYRLIKL